MSQVSTKPPSGMRDFLPDDVARRRHVVEIVRGVYESYGFQPLETPSIENLSVLLGKYGDEGDQLLYRLLHRREALSRVTDAAAREGRPVREEELADQGLRYDLTVPLARVVAQYGDLPRFFKRYQIQPVWRADRPGRGRFREFYQCDVDVTGTTSLLAEVEVCGAVADVLARLGFEDFVLHVNHRELRRAVIRAAGIDLALEATALVALDKLDKIGEDGVAQELEARGIGASSGRRMLELTRRGDADTNESTIARLRDAVDDSGRAALAQLEELVSIARPNAAGTHLAIHASLARGLSYYTGPIFEATVSDLAGSLGGGGRYDGLVGMFGKRQIPAVGFSLGLERIILVMTERGMYPDLRTGPDVMVAWMDVEPSTIVEVATRLRQDAVVVEIYPEPAKLGKQLQYANTVNARYAVIVGADEWKNREVTLKDLTSGEQERVALGALGTRVRG